MSTMNKAFITNADKQTVVRQLILDIKAPLTTAQVTVSSLEAIQAPSPALKRRLDEGELDTVQMLKQLDDSLTRAIDILDFYNEVLESR